MKGVTDIGPRGAPAIVFLHGGVINRHMWDPVMQWLTDDYRCLALDLPAHGALSGDVFTVDAARRRVLEVMDEREVSSATLVGLSLGGYVCQMVAAAAPDRTNGLVISGATIRYTGWDGLSTRGYGFLFPVASRPAMKAFARKMTEDLGEAVAAPILAEGLSAKGGGQALRRLPGHDYAAALAGLGIPVLIANGERDEDNREAEELFREHVPNAESVVIEDAGHACALQQPEAFAKAVRHLVEGIT